MILSAVSLPLLGAVDTAVMGHLDSPIYLAAVAAGATAFNVLFLGLNFLRMSTTGIAAQAFGAGDDQGVSDALVQPLLAGLALALLLLLVQTPVADGAAQLLQASPETLALFHVYFDIRIWSAPAALVNLVVIGWLLGMQDGRGPLVLTLIMNGVNIVLDLVLVVGLGMDVDGVAIATLIAEYLGAAIGLSLVARHFRQRTFVRNREHWLRPTAYRRLFTLNGHLFLRSCALMFVFAFITVRGARLGDVILAANALLMNFLYFFAYAADGIAHAAEALTGKAVGARDRAGLAATVRRCLGWCAVFAAGFALAYGLTGNAIVRLLSDLPAVVETAGVYLPWLVLLPLVSAWCFLYDGVYVGTTRAREMMIVMVGSVLLVFLPSWYLLAERGNHALWAALILFMAVRSAWMHLWYRRLRARAEFFAPG